MHRIFINDNVLILTQNSALAPANAAIEPYAGTDTITRAVAKLEGDVHQQALAIIHHNPDEVFNTFGKSYKIILAAGGVVFNRDKKILMIFRRGKWDLPKGKIEKGESREAAALREVSEECGITKLKIVKPLNATYHTYSEKEKRILKISYWYLMTTTDTKPLSPETGEDITEARWVKKEDINPLLKNSFASIQWLLNESKITEVK